MSVNGGNKINRKNADIKNAASQGSAIPLAQEIANLTEERNEAFALAVRQQRQIEALQTQVLHQADAYAQLSTEIAANHAYAAGIMKKAVKHRNAWTRAGAILRGLQPETLADAKDEAIREFPHLDWREDDPADLDILARHMEEIKKLTVMLQETRRDLYTAEDENMQRAAILCYLPAEETAAAREKAKSLYPQFPWTAAEVDDYVERRLRSAEATPYVIHGEADQRTADLDLIWQRLRPEYRRYTANGERLICIRAATGLTWELIDELTDDQIEFCQGKFTSFVA